MIPQTLWTHVARNDQKNAVIASNGVTKQSHNLPKLM